MGRKKNDLDRDVPQFTKGHQKRIDQAKSEPGRTGDLKKSRERAMLTAQGFWAQQGRKSGTGSGTADHSKKAGE